MGHVSDLATPKDFDDLVEASYERPVVLLKHSVACSLSARGRDQFRQLAHDEDVPLYEVIVQYARDVSNYIASETGVRHETPQVFVISQGEVTYHASHSRISVDALRRAAHEAASHAQ
jgi:bacillithiol system protein YtxJ